MFRDLTKLNEKKGRYEMKNVMCEYFEKNNKVGLRKTQEILEPKLGIELVLNIFFFLGVGVLCTNKRIIIKWLK